MDPDFEFDAGSSDDDLVVPVPSQTPKSQSAWDFAAYSESVAEEHARRNTTSVDAKISNALRERQVPLPDDDAEDECESGDEGDGDVVEDEVVEAEEKRGKKEKVKPGKGSAVSDGNKTRKDKFFASSEGATFNADSFIKLNLSRPLLRACEALGYHTPTPIQSACIPLALTGRDICGSAITGSGKTAAFTLPILERLLYRPKRINAIRVLIVTPTRELAAQVHSMVEKLAQFTDIRCCLIVGGLSTKEQEKALRSMPDIVIATPGRIIDHLRNSLSVGLEDLAVLILDEADRLLEFGFSSDISELIRQCPKRRQTMLFSATMTEEVDELVKLSMSKPVRLEADPSSKRPALLTEEIIRIRRMREVNQEAVLLALCSKTFTHKVIIFSGTKQAAHRLKIIFGLAGLKATELHGNLTQAQRLDALELFRRQEVDFLIATDVAARGLDIVGVQTVINFACPRDLTSYIHRVGRTARAGREGYAVTFVTDNDRSLVKSIAKKAGSQLKSRIVAQSSIIEWSETIEQMEDQISNILQDESTERIIRKADMEASKAENMINRKDDIFSRPKRTWHVSEREKKLVAEAAKQAALGKSQTGEKQVLSAQQAEDFKMKEKRRREHEKNLPRKKRRRLEAKREMMENEDDSDQEQGNRKEKSGKSVTDLAYQRAKSIKAKNRKSESGRTITKPGRTTKSLSKKQNRKEEMQELFQSDMNEKKQFRASKKGNQMTGKKNSKSFNSKKRYKRR